jgi:hypothetical protein
MKILGTTGSTPKNGDGAVQPTDDGQSPSLDGRDASKGTAGNGAGDKLQVDLAVRDCDHGQMGPTQLSAQISPGHLRGTTDEQRISSRWGLRSGHEVGAPIAPIDRNVRALRWTNRQLRDGKDRGDACRGPMMAAGLPLQGPKHADIVETDSGGLPDRNVQAIGRDGGASDDRRWALWSHAD